MEPVAPAAQQSILMHFIQVGGIYPLVLMGLAFMLTIWGLINLAIVRNRFVLAAQAILSFSPLAYAFVGLISTYTRFQVLANAPGPGDPIKIAETMSLAFVLGFVGSISTAIPAFVGILALARNVRAPATPIGKGAVGHQ